ncbi:MAG: alpha/beta hydrolase family protein, partial [Planctomycetota bacterium]
MMPRTVYFLVVLMCVVFICKGDEKHVPTIDELISVETIGSVRISPDGKWVVYSVKAANFEEDKFVTRFRLIDVASGRSFRLVSFNESAFNPKWSSDSKWLGFTSSREGGKNQIFAISPCGGEAIRLTDHETGVSSFEWSPDGTRIAFIARDAKPERLKARDQYMGPFTLVKKEYIHNHLWTIDVADSLAKPSAGRQRTRGNDFHVKTFSWSPDGARIAFSATIDPDIASNHTSDIYILDLSTDEVKKIVENPGPDFAPHWSPDGNRLLYNSHFKEERYFGHIYDLALISVDGGDPIKLTESFDEKPMFVAWNDDGIYFLARQRTASHLFRIDPTTVSIERVSEPDDLMGRWFTFTSGGRTMAFCAGSPTSLVEVFVTDVDDFNPRKLTDMTRQTDELVLGTREVISWKSDDGTRIEGVLIKPESFNPSKKYPLLCILHGGPTGIDRPFLLEENTLYYPADIWAARGALVLGVNYRGSTGYGQQFQLLNRRDLGLGAASDVISGVDHLVKKGWVDETKVGCMGWSHGGFIS